MNLLTRIEKNKNFWILLVILILFFLLRLPSLYEPSWYGDEGIYQVIGQSLDNNRLLYRDIWDNKLPLLYVTYALFESDQFTIRLVSLLFGIGSIISFYFLARELFLFRLSSLSSRKSIIETSIKKYNYRIVLTCTTLFAFLLGIPLLEGNIANAENFMLFPITLSGFLLLYHARCQKKNLLIATGLLLSIAFLFKAVGIFDFAAFLLFLLCVEIKGQKNMDILLKIGFLFLPFLIPILLTAAYFTLHGAFWDFFNASFGQNIGYVAYGNQFIISQGFLIIKSVLLISGCILLFLNRNRIPQTTLFILLWLFFSLFNAFFSQRPYTHYLLIILPSFCLFIGLTFYERKKQGLYTFICIVLIALFAHNFSVYKKIIPYYYNFISFIAGTKSITAYQAFFDPNTPRDYFLTQVITRHTKQSDSIFIWGNNAQVYKMANKLPPGRYTVAYHMQTNTTTRNETQKALENAKPKLIIIMPKQSDIPYSLSDYTLKYMIDTIAIYERIY